MDQSSPLPSSAGLVREPSSRSLAMAAALSLLFVVITRWPVARVTAFDFDEVGYLEMIEKADFPKHHTLFLAAGKLIGTAIGHPYRGFVVLDMIVSALALTAVWWMLRAIVPPRTAAAAALALGVGPVFWSYGAMAANYTAIAAVGAVLLGIVARMRSAPSLVHPYLAAVVLGIGTGYRQDIGLFWLPVFLVILWRWRWVVALQGMLIFAILNFAWLIPMLRDAGGWTAYREATAEFAAKAGWRNSVWELGFRDATLRYAVKGSMALAWTLGIGLLFVPAGAARMARREGGISLLIIMGLAALPALAMHGLVHFGVAGYAFHYIPSLVALMAVGLAPAIESAPRRDNAGALRGLAVAASLAALFLLYPTDLYRKDFRGDFDKAFARHTRVGLASPQPLTDPFTWRTRGSQMLPGNAPAGASADRTVLEIAPPR